MRRLRALFALCLAALLLACQAPGQLAAPPVAVQASALLQGQLVLPATYQTQASAGQVRANATVTLIDPATFQAKGTGITAPDGTFTVQALATFTPTLGSLYLLESNKTLGGAGNAAFRLRTLVQYTAAGWTSVTGAAIQLSSATTAVTLLWDHHGLTATDVLSKVTYDGLTRTHRFSNLTATLTEAKLREVENLVLDALLLGVDPVQVVRPQANGHYALSLSDRGRNRLVNGGFEVGASPFPGWRLNNSAIASYSVETATVYDASQSLKLTVNAAGDTWFGQGYNGTYDTYGLQMASGTPYTFSVYARGAAGGEKLAMAVNYQTPFNEAQSPIYTLTTSWQRYTWTLASAYNTDRAFFMLRNGSGVTQATFPASVYVDDVQMEEGGAPTTYAPVGNLTLEGFANSLDAANLTPTSGKVGRGVMVDSGTNLATNSSFEFDANSDGIPDNFSLYGGSAGTYTLDSDAVFGARSIKIVKGAASGDFPGYWLSYNFKAGHTYTFSIWVKGQNVSGPSNADFGLWVDCMKATGYSIPDAVIVPAPSGTFEWTRLTGTRTFTTDVLTARLYPMFRNKSGTVWFDGLQVEENTYASPYVGDGPDRLAFDANRTVNTQQGTIAFWYKPTFGWDSSSGAGNLMVLSNQAQDMVAMFGKAQLADGRFTLQWQIRRETPTLHDWLGADYVPTAPPWKLGEWHHVALSWGPAGMVQYLDGVPVGSNPYNGPIWTTSSAVNPAPNLGVLSFAGTGHNFTTKIEGALDGLKVWDTQRTAESVRREYLGLAK